MQLREALGQSFIPPPSHCPPPSLSQEGSYTARSGESASPASSSNPDIRILHSRPLVRGGSYKASLRPSSGLLGLRKGIGNLLAAVDGGDDDEQGAAGDDEAEGARGLVSFLICARGSAF